MTSIRPYRPADREDVYRICVLTGNNGGDATGTHSDDSVIPDVFAGPYLALEPELAFVVDTGEHVAGYALGTANTRRFVERYRAEWLPGFAERYLAPVDSVGTAGPASDLIELGLRPERMLIAEVDDYPAHLHIDLLPGIQGQGLGRALIRAVLKALRERGVPRLHLGVSAANTSALAFYERLGFVPLPSSTAADPLLGIATDARL